MKISLNWLNTLITTKLNTEELAKRLTFAGLEVEGIEREFSVKGGLEGIVIGEVLECHKHPNADKLSVTKVNIGEQEPKQIVCGAPNVAAGQKVLVAKVGSMVHPMQGEPFTINKSKIRGEVSEGMICAEDELSLGNSHEGIMVLPADAQVGMAAKEYFNVKEDTILEVAITANRGDAASHLGVARELSALTGEKVKLPEVKSLTGKNTPDIKVALADNEGCPRYSGIHLHHVKVGKSPDWLKERLQAIGIASINNVVDVTNYVLHELGQPIHAFDAGRISGGEIIVRRAKKGEKLTTLDKHERELQGEELLICDAEKPLAIAGVFGGLHSGITEATTEVFVESAYFNPAIIRKGARLHGLHTDASFRYERGADPDITVYALQRVVDLLTETAGAEQQTALIDVYPQKISPAKVTLHYAQLQKIAGAAIPEAEVKQILQALNIQVLSASAEKLELEIPLIKSDVTREIDVIEEIIRIYGLDKIAFSPRMSFAPQQIEKPYEPVQVKKVADHLAANGYYEIVNNSLFAENFPYLADTANAVKLLNPLSNELSILRPEFLHGGLQTIAYNRNRRIQNLRLFEFGKIYHQEKEAYKEQKVLGIWLTGLTHEKHWFLESKPFDLYHLKKDVMVLLQKLGVQVAEKHITYNSYDPTVLVNLLEVPQKALKHFDIKGQVFYAQLHWEQVLQQLGQLKPLQYKEINKFPDVERDLSLVLDKQVTYTQIEKVLKKLQLPALRKIDLFDVYEGERIDKDKKAYALSFVFADEQKTLVDAEVDEMMGKIIAAAEKELQALIRK